MRLAAQMRGGFYPAAPEAIAHAATFLCSPDQPFSIVDPCAGEGAAIKQLGELLGCSPSNIYAIELDDDRAETLRTTLQEGRVLAPANFFGCRATSHSFSFMWLNPPFDDGYGGQRVEDRFLIRAADWLMPGGVIALVCPENVIAEHSDTRRHFAYSFECCKIVPFPAAFRPFNEVVVFGHKRSRFGANAAFSDCCAPDDFLYHIPPSNGPRTFEKVEPTEADLQRLLASSPLRTHLNASSASVLPSPPLALGIGHVALLLASGHLDGVVQPEGKLPHVVRGTSRKREYVADVSEIENDDGTSTTRTTIAEKIELMVRTVDLFGEIRTFNETDAKED